MRHRKSNKKGKFKKVPQNEKDVLPLELRGFNSRRKTVWKLGRLLIQALKHLGSQKGKSIRSKRDRGNASFDKNMPFVNYVNW